MKTARISSPQAAVEFYMARPRRKTENRTLTGDLPRLHYLGYAIQVSPLFLALPTQETGKLWSRQDRWWRFRGEYRMTNGLTSQHVGVGVLTSLTRNKAGGREPTLGQHEPYNGSIWPSLLNLAPSFLSLSFAFSCGCRDIYTHI